MKHIYLTRKSIRVVLAFLSTKWQSMPAPICIAATSTETRLSGTNGATIGIFQIATANSSIVDPPLHLVLPLALLAQLRADAPDDEETLVIQILDDGSHTLIDWGTRISFASSSGKHERLRQAHEHQAEVMLGNEVL